MRSWISWKLQTFWRSPPVDVDPAELEIHGGGSEDEATALKKKESKTKQEAWNLLRTERLGTDPREVRAAIRAELGPGFYVSSAGKKQIRTLHKLGQCHILFRMRQSSTLASGAPKSTGFEDREHESSATNTSSSSEPGE